MKHCNLSNNNLSSGTSLLDMQSNINDYHASPLNLTKKEMPPRKELAVISPTLQEETERKDVCQVLLTASSGQNTQILLLNGKQYDIVPLGDGRWISKNEYELLQGMGGTCGGRASQDEGGRVATTPPTSAAVVTPDKGTISGVMDGSPGLCRSDEVTSTMDITGRVTLSESSTSLTVDCGINPPLADESSAGDKHLSETVKGACDVSSDTVVVEGDVEHGEGVLSALKSGVNDDWSEQVLGGTI